MSSTVGGEGGAPAGLLLSSVAFVAISCLPTRQQTRTPATPQTRSRAGNVRRRRGTVTMAKPWARFVWAFLGRSCHGPNYMVRTAGLEPARPEGQEILSLRRLPVPPRPHAGR